MSDQDDEASDQSLVSDEEAVRLWVQRTIESLNTTATGLARSAGVNQTTVTRFINTQSQTMFGKTLAKIAKVSPVPPPQLVQNLVDRHAGLTNSYGVYKGKDDAGDLPVWGVIPVGRTGEFRLNSLAVATFHRPLHLSAGRRIAVFYTHDESMAPRWEEGEPVIVDLARPAAAGTFALIRMTPQDDPDGTETFLLRRYRGRSNGAVQLERLDGVEQKAVPINRVLEIRRVLDWKDLLA